MPQKDFRDNYDKLIGEEITILQYPKGEMNYADGKILERATLERSKYEFAYNVSTDEGSSGSPIFLKGTTKVIGIHKGGSGNKDININYGDFIWPIFTFFKNFQENEVNLLNNNNFNNQSNNEIKVKNVLNLRNNYIYKNITKNDFGLFQDNSLENKLNQMTIICIIEINDNPIYPLKVIKLFGNDFVKNNINNCYLLINSQKKQLCEELILNKEQKKNNILEIKLIETNKITNMSHMFSQCSSFSGISKWDTKNINNMNSMFLPDISKWDTKNVTNMSHIFSGCSLLNSLPDISKWDILKMLLI